MRYSVIFIGLMIILCGIATGAVIDVPGDYSTIQDAIDAASTGDIVRVADGTYSGVGYQNLRLNGKEITVESANGAATCILDLSNAYQGFIFDSGETHQSIVQGFTILDGFASNGGGVVVESGAGPKIIDCVISSCFASENGGGIYIDSNETTRLIGCRFTGNNCTDDGGGLYGKHVAAVDCEFDNNESDHSGGGLYLLNDNQLHSCIIRENIATYGGGFFNHSVRTEMINCLVINNLAGADSAGGRISYGENSIINCTFTGNTAGVNYGGLRFISGSPEITNCIFWSNLPNELYFNAGSGPVVTYSVVAGGWPGQGNLDLDPLFVTGPQGDYYLSQVATGQIEDSRCVSGGNSSSDSICMDTPYGTICTDELTTRTDDFADSGLVDIGYHYVPAAFMTPTATPIPTNTPTGTPPTGTPTVTPTTTPGPQTIQVPSMYGTIQQAINAARDGDTVLVADGVYVGLWNKMLDLQGKSITVTSENGAGDTIIDCENDGYGIRFHSGEGADSIFQGFTILNGHHDNGGGVQVYDSAPVIMECLIEHCAATENGGGIFVDSSVLPEFIGCRVTSCTASDDGGGLYGQSFKLSSCILDSNTANGLGGGLYFRNDNQIHSCVIRDNTAMHGGGFYNHSTDTEMVNCLVTGNTALQWAGGGHLSYAPNAIINCTFSENFAGTNYGALRFMGSGHTVTNCIFWGDIPNELYFSSGSGPNVTYSVVEGGWTGTGNLDSDPLFTSASPGDYFLSEQAAGQGVDSPCLDSGSDVAGNICHDAVCLNTLTTRTDATEDAGVVNMGYHYPADFFVPTATPTVSPSPSPTPTVSPSPSPTPTVSPSPTPTHTYTQTPIPTGTPLPRPIPSTSEFGLILLLTLMTLGIISRPKS